MNRNRLKIVALLCILVSLACGCGKNSLDREADSMSAQLAGITSKGTVTTTPMFSDLYGASGFMVYACGHSDASKVAVESKPFVKNGTVWAPATKILWPGYATDFFAWAPYDAEKIVFSASEKSISYIVPTDVTLQQDLLVTKVENVPALYNTPLDLSFDHALAAVKLVTGSDFPGGEAIKSISLCNVNLTGKYQFTPAPDTEAWTELSGIGTMTLDKSASDDLIPSENAGMPITGNDETFFVIPQACTDDVHLEILYGEKMKYNYLPEDLVFHQGECVTLQVDGKDDWFYATVVRVEHRTDVDAGAMSI